MPLVDLPNPVVSIFSTGILEAAARGRDAWVDFPHPPLWLEEFWERYGMHRFGSSSHASAYPARRGACSPDCGHREPGGLMTLCVIPARGGSKGVPRKNLLDVAGKPLIVWTIEQALRCRDLDVVVSTDDEEIAEVARAAGARVPWLRPAELAQDTTPTEPVVRHAIESGDARARPAGRGDAAASHLARASRRHALPGAGRVRRHRSRLDGRASSSNHRSSGRRATRRQRRMTSLRGRGGRTSRTRPGATARPAPSTSPAPRSTSSTTTGSVAASASS